MKLNLPRAEDVPEHGEFLPTRPGPLFALSDVERAFGPTGLESVRAWLVNIASMRCDSVWHFTEAGTWSEACVGGAFDLGCSTAMATIVHLTHVGDEDTVARKIDMLRWVYAWRVDDNHVAVAEATYNLPYPERTTADIEVIRLVCEDCVCGHGFTGQTRVSITPAVRTLSEQTDNGDAPSRFHGTKMETTSNAAAVASPIPNFAAMPVPSAATKSFPSTSASAAPLSSSSPTTNVIEGGASSVPFRTGPRKAAFQSPYRAAASALIAVYVVVASMIYLSYIHANSLYVDAARFQSRAELAMLHQMTQLLFGGDYGEVQSELELFAARQHFESALVTNARGRVVAIAGNVRDVRIGDLPDEKMATTAKVFDLFAPGMSRQGQMYTWGVAVLAAPSVGVYASAGMLLCALVTGAMLGWMRRRSERAD